MVPPSHGATRISEVICLPLPDGFVGEETLDMNMEKDKAGGQKLAAILWFTAAALALAAAIIRYTRGDGVAWAPLAAALFLAAMGWNAWKRARETGAR